MSYAVYFVSKCADSEFLSGKEWGGGVSRRDNFFPGDGGGEGGGPIGLMGIALVIKF